jgi:hypothetical protein
VNLLSPPEYYYTKLAELKIQMIAEATKDAKEPKVLLKMRMPI